MMILEKQYGCMEQKSDVHQGVFFCVLGTEKNGNCAYSMVLQPVFSTLLS